jgi:hypothetical protein
MPTTKNGTRFWFGCLYISAAIALGSPVRAQPVSETQQTLITKFTASWCGECGSWAWPLLHQLRDSLPTEVIFAAAHVDNSFLQSDIALEWKTNFASTGVPRLYLNGMQVLASAGTAADVLQHLLDTISGLHQVPPVVNVGIETAWDGDLLQINTRTLFFQNTNGAFYLGVYLLENNVMAAQGGFSGWVSHQWLLRTAVTDLPFGSLLSFGQQQAGTNFLRSFSTSTGNWNIDHLDVMAVVWRREGNQYFPANVWKIPAKPLINSVQEPEMHSVRLFPNPAYASVNLQFPYTTTQESRFILYHPNGQQANTWTIPAGSHEIHLLLDNLPNGLYLWGLHSPDRPPQSGRLVVGR